MTRYTMKSGASSIPLTCSPSAQATALNEVLSLSYTATVSPVTISLGGTTPDTSGNQDILVGQQCTASLVGIPASCTVSNYQWNVSGTTFQAWSNTTPANYSSTGASTPGSLANPMASYKSNGFGATTSTSLSWYWVDAMTTTETITCTATVTPPAGDGAAFSVTATQKVIVYVPKIIAATGMGGSIIVAPTIWGATIRRETSASMRVRRRLAAWCGT